MNTIFKTGCVYALVAAAAFTTPAHAYDYELWLKAELRIDAEGRVEALEWRETRDGARLIADRLEPVVRSWEFEPGRLNGTAAVTDTFLTVQVLGEDQEDGGVSLSLGKVGTGAVLDTSTPPRYPIHEARNGNSAELVATLDVSPDGSVRVADVQVEASRRGSGKAFVESVREVAVEWKPSLERVGGVPVAASLRVPVQFCGPGDLGWCVKQNRERVERLRAKDVSPLPATGAIALESAVKLLTPVRGTGI